MGSCSVVQCVSHLMGQPLYCSAVDAGLWGKREAVVMAPPLHVTQQYHLASMAARLFSTGYFLPQSPPSHPLNQSLHSQQQPLPWDCSTNPKLQLPAAAPSRGPESLSGVCMAVAKTVILVPFRLPQINCFTLGLKCFSCDSDHCPMWRLDPCFSSPTHQGQVQSY